MKSKIDQQLYTTTGLPLRGNNPYSLNSLSIKVRAVATHVFSKKLDQMIREASGLRDPKDFNMDFEVDEEVPLEPSLLQQTIADLKEKMKACGLGVFEKR